MEPLRIKFNEEYFDDGARIFLGKLIASNDSAKDWHDKTLILENTSVNPLVELTAKTNMPGDTFTIQLPQRIEPGQSIKVNFALKASKLFTAKLTDLYLRIDYLELRTY